MSYLRALNTKCHQFSSYLGKRSYILLIDQVKYCAKAQYLNLKSDVVYVSNASYSWACTNVSVGIMSKCDDINICNHLKLSGELSGVMLGLVQFRTLQQKQRLKYSNSHNVHNTRLNKMHQRENYQDFLKWRSGEERWLFSGHYLIIIKWIWRFFSQNLQFDSPSPLPL